MARMARDPAAGDARTSARILDIAERLVQGRGFNGFSYADVAAELQLTKASLHYHFRGKAELGEALIGRYAERFGAALAAIEADVSDAPTRLERYAQLYADVLHGERHVPLRHAGRRVPDASRTDARRRHRASSTTTRPGSRACSSRAVETARCASTARPARPPAASSAASKARCSSPAPTATRQRFHAAAGRLRASLTAPAPDGNGASARA